VVDNIAQYIASLSDVLPQSESPLLKIHLDFLLRHVAPRCSHDNSLLLFKHILFPLLLFSKDRRTGWIAWKAIREATQANNRGLTSYGLLSGCVEASSLDLESSKSSTLGKKNLAIARCIADNVFAANNRADHLDFLLEAMVDDSLHTSYLAVIVMRALLRLMSGGDQIAAAQRVLDVLAPKSLKGLEDFDGDVDVVSLCDLLVFCRGIWLIASSN